MPKVNRFVHFHQLQLKRNNPDAYLFGQNLYKKFNAIVNKYGTEYEDEGYTIKSLKLTSDSDEVILDVIQMDEFEAFCRIAKRKDLNSYQKRNSKTMKPEKIILSAEQRLEVYSYFLLNFEFGIIANIYHRSSPAIRNLEYLFAGRRFKGKQGSYKLLPDILQIPNNNAMSMMSKVTYFSGLEARFAIPAEQFFKNAGINLTKNKYKSLAKLKSDKITLLISGGDENMNEDKYKTLQNCVSELFELKLESDEHDNLSGEIDRLIVKANVNESNMKHLNMLDEHFTHQVELQYESSRTYIPMIEIRKVLDAVYNSQEDEVRSRLGTSMIL